MVDTSQPTAAVAAQAYARMAVRVLCCIFVAEMEESKIGVEDLKMAKDC
jgi:hypothetical protein